MQVADVHRILRDVVRKSSVSPYVRPGFTPAPAIHMLKQRG
jgi:hypothetical protein